MRNSVSERRKALGLTQTELALASQLSRPLISAVETGRHVPSVKAALAIAEVLGTTVEEVFGEPDTMENQVPALGNPPAADAPIVAVRVGDLLSYHPPPDRGVAGASSERAHCPYRHPRVERFQDSGTA